MSRVARPAEKVLATASIYRALVIELGFDEFPGSAVVASLIEASVRIAMGTDTRDLGIMSDPRPRMMVDDRIAEAEVEVPEVCDDCGGVDGHHVPGVEH
jgi:hypothetical protein